MESDDLTPAIWVRGYRSPEDDPTAVLVLLELNEKPGIVMSPKLVLLRFLMSSGLRIFFFGLGKSRGRAESVLWESISRNRGSGNTSLRIAGLGDVVEAGKFDGGSEGGGFGGK